VGYGIVADQATGYPGYNSIIPRDAVAIGEILRRGSSPSCSRSLSPTTTSFSKQFYDEGELRPVGTVKQHIVSNRESPADTAGHVFKMSQCLAH
jgi:hypothetical protein